MIRVYERILEEAENRYTKIIEPKSLSEKTESKIFDESGLKSMSEGPNLFDGLDQEDPVPESHLAPQDVSGESQNIFDGMETETQDFEVPFSQDLHAPSSQLSVSPQELASVKTDWKLRKLALQNLVQEVNSGNLPLESLISDFGPELRIQLTDLRSSMFKEVCDALLAMASKYGPKFGAAMDQFIPGLLTRAHDMQTGVIRKYAHECLSSLLNATKHARSIKQYVNGMKSMHPIVRQRCCEYSLLILDFLSNDGKEKHHEHEYVKHVLTKGHSAVVLKLCQDRDPGVRKAAKTLAMAMTEKFPNACKNVQKFIS